MSLVNFNVFSTRFHDSEEVVDDDDAVGNEESEELSAYQQLRATNIKEREREMTNLGIIPHSQVREEWENCD